MAAIGEILSITKAVGDVAGTIGNAGKTGASLASAAAHGYADAKSAIMSIAEKSKKSIMMYKVLISSGIREADLAVKITKYLERMYAIFTLLVLGYNPMAENNREIDSIIKSVSAESFPATNNEVQKAALRQAMVSFENEHDYGHRRPRIGKNYVSTESGTGSTGSSGSSSGSSSSSSSSSGNGSGTGSNSNNSSNSPTWSSIKNNNNNNSNSNGKFGNSANDGRPKYTGNGKALDVSFCSNVASKSDKNMPTIINLNVNTRGGQVKIPIAVKCNMYPITSEDMRLVVESGITSGVTHTNVLRQIKHKSGEISTLAWLFKTDENERNAKLYASLGKNPWYIELQKRKAAAKNSFWGSFLTRFGADYNYDKTGNNANKSLNAAINAMPPTASLILTKEDLVSATRLNADHFTKNEGFIARFMKDTFLLCFGIVDLTAEKCDFFFMGYTNPFTVSFKELDVDESDSNKALYEAIKELSRKV